MPKGGGTDPAISGILLQGNYRSEGFGLAPGLAWWPLSKNARSWNWPGGLVNKREGLALATFLKSFRAGPVLLGQLASTK